MCRLPAIYRIMIRLDRGRFGVASFGVIRIDAGPTRFLSL